METVVMRAADDRVTMGARRWTAECGKVDGITGQWWTASNGTNKVADAVRVLALDLRRWLCREHWQQTDKDLVLGYATKFAEVYYRILPLAEMDAYFL